MDFFSFFSLFIYIFFIIIRANKRDLHLWRIKIILNTRRTFPTFWCFSLDPRALLNVSGVVMLSVASLQQSSLSIDRNIRCHGDWNLHNNQEKKSSPPSFRVRTRTSEWEEEYYNRIAPSLSLPSAKWFVFMIFLLFILWHSRVLWLKQLVFNINFFFFHYFLEIIFLCLSSSSLPSNCFHFLLLIIVDNFKIKL